MQLKRPVDLGKPLNSVYGLKYLWLNFTFIGINPPATTNQLWLSLYYIYSAVINFVAGFCLPASLVANLWFINSRQELVGNLSLTTTIVVSTLKQMAILMFRRRLLKSNDFLKVLDERSSHHSQDRFIILNAIRYCHIYFVGYISMYFFCACGFAYIGWMNHRLVYSGWFPTFLNDSESNYVLAFAYQNMAQTFTVFQNGNNDMYPLCYLTLVIAHFETLASRIRRIGKEVENNSEKQNIEELKMCIMDHKNLLSYFDCIRPVISTTLFLQFFVTGLALCLTAINLIAFKRDFTQQFFAIVYVGVILVQVFPCCWSVNVLMEKSDYLTTAIYSCNWMDQNNKFRKMLIIFMQRSQKHSTVLAGNFTPVTLQTFLTIIRFSFSMFTIISQM